MVVWLCKAKLRKTRPSKNSLNDTLYCIIQFSHWPHALQTSLNGIFYGIIKYTYWPHALQAPLNGTLYWRENLRGAVNLDIYLISESHHHHIYLPHLWVSPPSQQLNIFNRHQCSITHGSSQESTLDTYLWSEELKKLLVLSPRRTVGPMFVYIQIRREMSR